MSLYHKYLYHFFVSVAALSLSPLYMYIIFLIRLRLSLSCLHTHDRVLILSSEQSTTGNKIYYTFNTKVETAWTGKPDSVFNINCMLMLVTFSL